MDPDRTLTMAEALDRLPKVELHCHIEGTMRLETLVELAARSGHALGTSDPKRSLSIRQSRRFPEVVLARPVVPRDP